MSVNLFDPISKRSRPVQLDKVIGQGGRSEVYSIDDSGNDPRLNLLALKIYNSSPPSDIEDFVRECLSRELDKIPQILKSEKEAYPIAAAPICTVQDAVNEVIGVAVLRIDQDRFVSAKEAVSSGIFRGNKTIGCNAALQLAWAVEQVHKKGFIIGDLSDDNVLIDQSGYVCLIDCDAFGLVAPPRMLYESTANWRAPECTSSTSTQLSDNFIVAAHCCRFLLDGVGPFDGKDPNNETNTPQSNIDNHRSWLWCLDMPTPGKRNQMSYGLNDLPDYLAYEILRLLNHDPKLRPESLTGLIEAIGRAESSIQAFSCGHLSFNVSGCVICRTVPASASEKTVTEAVNRAGFVFGFSPSIDAKTNLHLQGNDSSENIIIGEIVAEEPAIRSTGTSTKTVEKISSRESFLNRKVSGDMDIKDVCYIIMGILPIILIIIMLLVN